MGHVELSRSGEKEHSRLQSSRVRAAHVGRRGPLATPRGLGCGHAFLLGLVSRRLQFPEVEPVTDRDPTCQACVGLQRAKFGHAVGSTAAKRASQVREEEGWPYPTPAGAPRPPCAATVVPAAGEAWTQLAVEPPRRPDAGDPLARGGTGHPGPTRLYRVRVSPREPAKEPQRVAPKTPIC